MQGHFIQGHKHRLFVLQLGALQPQRCILCLPPLFEEMNLSRAIIAKASRYLVEKGYTVFCLDYAGTGDSEGELESVDAELWRQDLKLTLDWLAEKGVQDPVLWGVRFGALLAMANLDELSTRYPGISCLLWKPVLNGKLLMSQFIRVKQANAMIQGDEKIDWRKKILEGETVEVAGYPISAALLQTVESMVMPSELPENSAVAWMELASANLPLAVNKLKDQWHRPGVVFQSAEGLPFWQTPELFEQPELHAPTYSLLQELN
ncbi:CocE/NonD family hydrolase [Aliiglaciecola sp. CAU 1673]|uniref:CocE/NonD family hydrolase n=1 Tax=Aliiglaciecola sp. CAU 1673 TaxID=3032595 RepID=UPI0023DA8BA0|nr:CocE/NonD family hydrolase [Aliiglaciecola sp. CAU 1673]MDF2177308.1 CocE/NonD family hydrolase [Aliiglaciecola sp. CAU 1673]